MSIHHITPEIHSFLFPPLSAYIIYNYCQ